MILFNEGFPSLTHSQSRDMLDCISSSKSATSHHFVYPKNTRMTRKYQYVLTHQKDDSLLPYHTLALQDNHIYCDPKMEPALEKIVEHPLKIS